MKNNILIICGGTGGHFYPGLSIARKFKDRNGTVRLLLTGRHSQDQQKTALSSGIESDIIPTSPSPKGFKGIVQFLLHFIRGYFLSMGIIRRSGCQSVLAMGSFHSLAPALAAKTLGIPLYLHDGNARVGKANLFLSRLAKHLALSFPPVNPGKIKCAWSVTGMPLRDQLLKVKLSKAEAIMEINRSFKSDFSADLPCILVFGGSQGAEKINKTVPESMKLQGKPAFQVIHISGAGAKENLEKYYSGSEFKHLIIEKTEEMSLLYSSSDLVICRSGGSTVAELAIFAKFAILIPYPHATDNHQEDNAGFYCSSGAGLCIDEAELSATKLGSTIASFLEKPDHFIKLGNAAKSLAKPDAASEILKLAIPSE